jgi:hypothetical protein
MELLNNGWQSLTIQAITVDTKLTTPACMPDRKESPDCRSRSKRIYWNWIIASSRQRIDLA